MIGDLFFKKDFPVKKKPEIEIVNGVTLRGAWFGEAGPLRRGLSEVVWTRSSGLGH